MPVVAPLPADTLFRRCDPGQFAFQTTAELEDLAEIIGQQRALDALSFGIAIRRTGYNLFALGPNGAGKFTAVRRSLAEQAAGEPVPGDWCYVFHFDQPHRPNALQLPAGQA
ncbi:MAG: Lon-like protease helical domain-containing protein, partial [Gammaproteobacteria bacterium]